MKPTCGPRGATRVPRTLASLAALEGARGERGRFEGGGRSMRAIWKINGRDLMTELAMKPGPRIGKVLEALLELVLAEPELNERETLLRLAREILAAGPA